jgi:hypothetical protein
MGGWVRRRKQTKSYLASSVPETAADLASSVTTDERGLRKAEEEGA